jgi:3-isopropylmalate/(R)-2-methylmalate dehydratase large subunit
MKLDQTMTEQIFSRKSGRNVCPGELLNLAVDAVMVHDFNAPHVLEVLQTLKEKLGTSDTFSRTNHSPRVLGVIDHLWPAPTIDSAIAQDTFRKLGATYGFTMAPFGEGICHHLMLEMGFVKPGDIVIGTDSHSCSYGAFNAFGTGMGASETAATIFTGRCWFKVPKATLVRLSGKRPFWLTAMDINLALNKILSNDGCLYQTLEFAPDNLDQFSIDARITMCNMAVELGSKSAIMPRDAILESHLAGLRIDDFSSGPVFDPAATYHRVVEINLEDLLPQIAVPPNFRSVCNVRELEGMKVDQIVIGGCTNGRMEDMAAACRILSQGMVSSHVRLFIAPASRSVMLEMTKQGMTEVFLRHGATILPPGCGPCSGMHLGVMGDGQIVLSTTNRNSAGRMGSHTADIYLVSPATAAASALHGEISDPCKQERM